MFRVVDSSLPPSLSPSLPPSREEFRDWSEDEKVARIVWAIRQLELEVSSPFSLFLSPLSSLLYLFSFLPPSSFPLPSSLIPLPSSFPLPSSLLPYPSSLSYTPTPHLLTHPQGQNQVEQLEETKKEILIDNVLEWKKFKFLVALACSYMVSLNIMHVLLLALLAMSPISTYTHLPAHTYTHLPAHTPTHTT